ncbi:MAG: arsenate reductase ArsC [Deltaproteobacteria bacterium]|nr:arsenate reductase ArsC [Deltaproteobacteria bacterium]
MTKKKVIFLCTGNTARSQMAEAFLRKYANDKFEVYSAGLEPSQINPLTKNVMEEIGLDLKGQESKGLEQFLGKNDFSYVITVCGHADEKCPMFPGNSVRIHWPFDDPACVQGSVEEKLAEFRKTRDQIEHQIKSWLKEA